MRYARILLVILATSCSVIYSMQINDINTNPPKHLGNNERAYNKGFSKREFIRAVTVSTHVFLRAINNDSSNVCANGVIGASIGAFLGKIAVSLAGHGLIYIVAGLTGPFVVVTAIALEGAFGAIIESASLAGAVAGGITLGAITGPI